MLSALDLERLIAVKKLELEKEKTSLGLSEQSDKPYQVEDKENAVPTIKSRKRVSYQESRAVRERDEVIAEKKEKSSEEPYQGHADKIPPDLERYIRRYLGLPVMLRAGEYSPNNPLARGERAPGDALRGLGEYERQRHTLRRVRQQQYREYLDQQAKKKQEAKEQADRERREREKRDREREERERELLQERDRRSPERRRGSVNNVAVTSTVYCNNKVDAGVQVEGTARPLSVAVQTEEVDLFRPPSPTKSQLTEAERELSPRTVQEPSGESWPRRGTWSETQCSRRRSYGDFNERSAAVKNSDSELRHSYMPSIFDAEAIRLRNLQAEKEAAERRQYYQKELKNQILEQQRIREERKSREKLLEQAEMRRLEEQLRMLRTAQRLELGAQHRLAATMQENTTEYNNKRTELQKEIDMEQQKILRVATQPAATPTQRDTRRDHSKLPFFYPHIQERSNEISSKKPYSINIPDSSIFSPNYDVDNYLRRNLNFDKEKVLNRINSENNIGKERNARPTYIPTVPSYISSPNEGLVSPSQRRFDADINANRFKERPHLENVGLDSMTQFGENLRRIDENSVRNDVTDDRNYVDELGEIRHDDDREVVSAVESVRRQTCVENTKIRPVDAERTPTAKNSLQSAVTTSLRRNHIERDSRPDVSEAEIGSCLKPMPSEADIIPVLKHTPQTQSDLTEDGRLSEKMKLVADKWKVPAVQKNILSSVPNEEGKSVSILTQLGSIRRQLQLEQLKLDRLLPKDE